MSGIFPNGSDGGLPPNTSDPLNPNHAYNPINPPLDTSALYYGNGCDVRLRPEVVNSLISELAALSDRAGISYQAGRLTNTELAVRYLIQRGLPKGTYTAGGPNAYTATLDPTMTGYNNHMVLCVVPNVTNESYVRLSVDGRPSVPVLRNDARELMKFDWEANVPVLIAYWNGAFYMIGLCKSQVFLRLDTLNIWVRTDGNDATGDGTENTPTKAYRTLQAAWNSLALRFAPSPTANINFYLGIPGLYEPAALGPFGSGNVSITGDVSNQGAYRIAQEKFINGCCLRLNTMNATLRGITLQGDQPATQSGSLLWTTASVALHNCRFEMVVFNELNTFIGILQSGLVVPFPGGTVEFLGNGVTLNYGIGLSFGGHWGSTPPPSVPALISWRDINYSGQGIFCTAQSHMSIGTANIAGSNVFGRVCLVSVNSSLLGNGKPLPGTIPGVADASTFGVYIP